jgi:hypothetical protein
MLFGLTVLLVAASVRVRATRGPTGAVAPPDTLGSPFELELALASAVTRGRKTNDPLVNYIESAGCCRTKALPDGTMSTGTDTMTLIEGVGTALECAGMSNSLSMSDIFGCNTSNISFCLSFYPPSLPPSCVPTVLSPPMQPTVNTFKRPPTSLLSCHEAPFTRPLIVFHTAPPPPLSLPDSVVRHCEWLQKA